MYNGRVRRLSRTPHGCAVQIAQYCRVVAFASTTSDHPVIVAHIRLEFGEQLAEQCDDKACRLPGAVTQTNLQSSVVVPHDSLLRLINF